jgi:hypothetical protein
MSGDVVKEAMIRTTELGLRHRGAQLKKALTRGSGRAQHAGESAGRFVGAVSRAASDAVRDRRKGGSR